VKVQAENRVAHWPTMYTGTLISSSFASSMSQTPYQAMPEIIKINSNIANKYCEFIKSFSSSASRYAAYASYSGKTNVTWIWKMATGVATQVTNKITFHDGMKETAMRVGIILTKILIKILIKLRGDLLILYDNSTKLKRQHNRAAVAKDKSQQTWSYSTRTLSGTTEEHSKAESSLDRHMTAEVANMINDHRHEGDEEDVIEITADIIVSKRLI